MHFPGNSHREGLQLLGVEIIITIGAEIPFGGKIKGAAEIQVGIHIFFEFSDRSIEATVK